jgi:hypothetical protein
MEPSAGNWIPPSTIFTAVPAANTCDEAKSSAIIKHAKVVIGLVFIRSLSEGCRFHTEHRRRIPAK